MHLQHKHGSVDALYDNKDCMTRGHAVAQRVSRQPLTTQVRIRAQASECEIYGEQSGKRTGFLLVLRFLPVSTIAPVFHTHSFITRAM